MMRSYKEICDSDWENMTEEEMAMYLEETIFADCIGGHIKSFGNGGPVLGRESNEIVFELMDGKKFKVVVEEEVE